MSLVSTSSGGLPWQLHPNPSGTSTTLRRPKLSTLCVLTPAVSLLSGSGTAPDAGRSADTLPFAVQRGTRTQSTSVGWEAGREWEIRRGL